MSDCGTRAGYQGHRRRGEPIDEACREANAQYSKERRKAAKEPAPAAPAAAAAPAASTEISGIKFLALAEEGVSHWSTAVGYIDPETKSPTVVDDGSLGLPVGERLVERVLELVEKHRPAVLIISRENATTLGRFDPRFTKLPETKVAIGEDPASWIPESDGSRARHLAASNVGIITFAARVQHDRQELDRDHLELFDGERRVAGAVIKRGRMLDVGKYERPDPVYEEIPQGHPALRSEVWVGVIPSAKKTLPWAGRR